MKRRMVVTTLLLALGVVMFPAGSAAGTWFTGVKYWGAQWDSGILDYLEQDLAPLFEIVQFTAHSDPGSGYLAGPLLGYQTSNGKLSFSAAPMVVSSFTQPWSGHSIAGTGPGAMTPSGNVELERIDVDLAVNYTLNDRYKLFVGYKYQDMNMDFALSFNAVGNTIINTYKVDATAHIPTVGVGAVYPLSEDLVASGQFGVLYSLPYMTIANNNSGDVDDIFPHPGLGFNTELNLTYRPMSDLLLQLGYRYQVFEIKARGPGREAVIQSYDITYGGTLSMVYTF